MSQLVHRFGIIPKRTLNLPARTLFTKYQNISQNRLMDPQGVENTKVAGVAFNSTSTLTQDISQHRSSYRWFLPIQTRWKDNDQYGHVNNAVYHAIFDSVINVYLIRKSGLDPTSSTVPRGYMLSNSCRFSSSARYPDIYLAGLSVSHIGNSSIKYQLGLFPKISPASSLLCDMVQGHWPEDDQVEAFEESSAVTGEFVHVFVSPDTGKSCPIPGLWRPQLQKLMAK